MAEARRLAEQEAAEVLARALKEADETATAASVVAQRHNDALAMAESSISMMELRIESEQQRAEQRAASIAAEAQAQADLVVREAAEAAAITRSEAELHVEKLIRRAQLIGHARNNM